MTVGAIVFRDAVAKDADAGINALIEYKVVPGDTELGTVNTTSDGYGTFQFQSVHQPILILQKSLDYENVSRYLVTIVASVSPTLASPRAQSITFSFKDVFVVQDRALNTKDRLSSTTTLTVNVEDVDDQGPAFQYNGCPLNSKGYCLTPTYIATVSALEWG